MPKKNETKVGDPAQPPKPKRKRVKVRTGQLVAVPMLDGTWGLVHVAVYDGRITAAHYAHRGKTPQELLEGLDEAFQRGPITILAVTMDMVYDGLWPVIGAKEPAYPPAMLDMKGVSYTANMSQWVFNAYYGLVAWDHMKDPRFFEKILLPGVPVPPTVRYKRDFPPEEAAAPAAKATSADESGPEVTKGPGEIHIEIRYPGDALPSIELLHRRQALEQALEKAGAGEVTDAGGGGGVMDIYLHTKDARRSMPLVVAAVKAAGFEQDAKVEVTQ